MWFKANILAKLRNKLSYFKIGELAVIVIEKCKTLWILHDQKLIFGKDNFTKVKNSLNLFYDDKKILRVKTSISGIESFSFDKKFPILLKKDSYFTELIVLNAHAVVFHSGFHSSLNYIRPNYLIFKWRQTIKQLLQRYLICKYVQGKSLLGPEVPSLPEFRVKCNHSFEFVGVNFAGLIYYKSRYKFYKTYTLLFTCGVTRAVNIMLTKNLGNESLILAPRRFLAKRGKAELIISDNFKTFQSEDVKVFLRDNYIQWKLNFERSPWWGGFYERLIGIMKSCLKKIIGKALLTFEELRTVIYEIRYR